MWLWVLCTHLPVSRLAYQDLQFTSLQKSQRVSNTRDLLEQVEVDALGIRQVASISPTNKMTAEESEFPHHRNFGQMLMVQCFSEPQPMDWLPRDS
jgi:hypothetical protein